MPNKNICKIATSIEEKELYIHNFVFEMENIHQFVNYVPKVNTLNIVCNGSGFLTTDYGKYDLKVGTMFFTLIGCRFTIEDKGDLAFYFISFDGKRGDDLLNRFDVLPTKCCFDGHERIIPVWQDSISHSHKENLDILSESMLLYAFSDMKKSLSNQSDTLTKIIEIINNRYTDPNFCIETISKEIGYHPKYLSKFIKTNLNMGFSEYLTTIRIKQAIFLMDQGVISVKNVAILSGYNDPLYFSRVFKKYMDISPKQYIEKKQKC